MKKDDILVVKPTMFMRKETEMLKALHEYILEQKVTGVIVLPSWVDVIITPSNVEIKVEEPIDENKKCYECKYFYEEGIDTMHDVSTELFFCGNPDVEIHKLTSPYCIGCCKWNKKEERND